MRVLLRDQSDNTYIVLEAESLYYDEQAQELHVASENYDYTVHRIVKANADSFMRELFETGKVDLTQFEASADK